MVLTTLETHRRSRKSGSSWTRVQMGGWTRVQNRKRKVHTCIGTDSLLVESMTPVECESDVAVSMEVTVFEADRHISGRCPRERATHFSDRCAERFQRLRR